MNQVLKNRGWLMVFCFLPVLLTAQNRFGLSPEQANEIVDFTIANKAIWAITKGYTLQRYDCIEEARPQPALIDTAVSAFAFNRTGHLVVATLDRDIKEWMPETNTWNKLGTTIGVAHALAFDKNNEVYAVTGRGIEIVSDGSCHYSDSSINRHLGLISFGGSYLPPSACLMDEAGGRPQLWVGFSRGEFGGDIVVFDINTRKFMALTADSAGAVRLGVLALMKIEDGVYSLHGTAHMRSMNAALCRIDSYKASALYHLQGSYDDDLEESINRSIVRQGKEFNAGCYNAIDSAIYACSPNGIFKVKLDADVSNLDCWQKVFDPVLGVAKGADPWLYRYKKAAALGAGKLLILDDDGRFFVMSGGEMRYWY